MEVVLSLYHCPVMSKAGQMKQANFVKAFLTQANRVAEACFHTCRYVSVVLQISNVRQLAPKTIRPGRLTPNSRLLVD